MTDGGDPLGESGFMIGSVLDLEVTRHQVR